MNLLKTIIERLNQRVEVANIFDKQFNLCELNVNGNDKAWVHYIGNGQAEVVTNFDAKNGTLFWAKRGKVSVAKTEAYKMSGCKQLYVTTFPLTAYAIVRKSHLPCDAEDAQDWLASRVYKLTSGTDPLFKQSIGVINYEVVPSGYANEIKTLTANYEWACVSVDMDVQVITTSEDGCYDTCATGDIPLPDLPACVPCLTEVAVDGVTITGNGTAADPLVAIGGGGGGGVTSVGGIAPIASSGGTTPDISITQASTSVDGYLSSTDWNTFDGKFDVPTGAATDYLDGTGTPTPFPTLPTGTVTSVDLTMPVAFNVTGNPVTSSGTLAVTAAGVATQYIRGDGQLANFPTSSGGGASVSYYLNGSVSQGTFGGVAMREINKVPVIGGGTDFTINADGYIQSFITDANDPNQLAIPAGNWNFETYFSASSSGGSPKFYIELYKWDGATLTLIASNSTNPENITGGTAIDLYLTALAVPQTVLLATDRLAVRFYVIHSGRTITMHTEDNHLSQIITTFSTGLTALNGLTAQTQLLAVGTSGTDFAISSVTDTHTFNLPTASAANRGALSTADWTAFDAKQDAISLTTTGTSGAATLTGATLNIPIYGGGGQSFPYIQNEFTSSNGGAAIIKIPASNIIFAAYTTTQTVVCYNSLTSVILSTTTVGGAIGLVYVATTGQVWAFGSTAASITRFTATTGVSLGSTAVTGLTASCRGVYDDSSVTGNVYAYNGGTMNVINATTYARTGVSIGAGSGSNELSLVTSGVQSDLLVGTVNIGVFGFNKTTNTLAYGPTTAFSSSTIKYIPTLNKIITVSSSLNSIYVYTPATATTITLAQTIAGVFSPFYIDFDETENFLFVVSGFTSTSNLKLSIFDLTTLLMIKTFPLTAITSSSNNYIANDKANKTLYVVGITNNGSINKIIYA